MAQLPTVAYVNKVALAVQSDIYVDTLENDSIMRVLSPRIRIALTPRNTITDTDQYLYVSEAVTTRQENAMIYRVYINQNSRRSLWRSLPERTSGKRRFPYDCLLADTLLQGGDSLVLEFAIRGAAQLVQRCVFVRENIVPVIQQFREKNAGSRVEDSILSKALHRNDRTLAGFTQPAGHRIVVSAGKQLEMLLLHHGLSRDSSVRYRVRSSRNNVTGGWNRSGHYLTLNKLPANDSLILELSYEGLKGVNAYTIKILPFWFQRGWAIALFIVSGVLLLVVLPYSLYKRKLRRDEEKRVRDETDIKRSQSKLNPHFIFNSLNSVGALVSEGDAEKATAYLSDFSDLMRNNIRNSEIMFTRLSEDLAITEKYIRIEQLRFDFRYAIHTDPSIDLHTVEFPPMLLQPTLENAVKHGVSGMHEEGMIDIQVLRKDEDMVITISDNGPLRPKPATKGTSTGIPLTRERIDKLNKLEHYDIRYELRFLPDKTTAIFHFKNWL